LEQPILFMGLKLRVSFSWSPRRGEHVALWDGEVQVKEFHLFP